MSPPSGSPRLTKRWFLKATAVTAAALWAGPLLAACGAAPESPKPAATAPAKTADASAPKAAAPAKSADPVTLVWDTFRGVGTPYPDEIIKTFRAKHANVTIEFRPLPTTQTDSYPKLYAMYAAGNIGDLYSFDPVDYEFFRAVPQGLVRALDDYIAGENYDVKQFYETFMDLQRLNGKVWGLPAWGHPGDGGVVFNELAVAEAGLKVPDHTGSAWTMDAFYDMAVKLHKTSGGRAERFGVNLGLALRHVTCTARAFNAELISEDGKKALATEPGAVKALRWIYDLAQKEKVVSLPGSFEGNADALFASGRLGAHQAGALAMFNVKDAIKDPGKAKMKAVLFPKRTDGRYPSQTRGGTWQVGSRSKNPEWAWEFVKHKASREGALAFTHLSKSSVALVRPDVLNDPYFADPNFEPYKETLLRAMPNTVPANARGTELQDAFAQAHSLVYLGKAPFDQGVKDLNDALQRVLDKPTT
ncbi:MAG TPA: extracellular solute-binding protein [Chloroflexota bacterium]|jgi:ABC-type glycerol-3-phosphate transport system substrate-binding protein|nr:extracellular solute-binding protein [Chloroflexota bacterium]